MTKASSCSNSVRRLLCDSDCNETDSLGFDISSSSSTKTNRSFSFVLWLSSPIEEEAISGICEVSSGSATDDSFPSCSNSVGRLLCDSDCNETDSLGFDISSSSSTKTNRSFSFVLWLSSPIEEEAISGICEVSSGSATDDSFPSCSNSVGRLLCNSTEKVVNSAGLGKAKSVSSVCNRSITIRSG